MLEESHFYDQATLEIYHGKKSKKALKTLPENLWPIAYRKFTLLNRAQQIEHLRVPPGNQLESLKGNREGQHSIRINDQYRICFVWDKDKPVRIEITDYH